MAEGNTVELDRVLLIANGDKITIGTPTIDQAKVIATSKGEGKAKKIIIFKYKSKTRYHKKTGHRQRYTSLAIDKIIGTETAEEKPKKRVSRSKKEVTQSGT